MFYRPEDGHGLRHNPFKAIVSPRPIGWISTRVEGFGDNLAPYSFFNAVSDEPPMVMFSGGWKDTVKNALEAGVFAANVVAEAQWRKMNESSAGLPRGADEFQAAGVAKAECQRIDCPRVADAPATLECEVVHHLALEGGYHMVIGRVLGVHIRADCLKEGRFDVTSFRPVSRLGYMDYAFTREVAELARPKSGGA